jgi:hypothetical protein
MDISIEIFELPIDLNNAAQALITLPAGTTGRVFVNYNKSTETAVSLGKSTDSVPPTRKLLIHAIFHDPCDANLVYAGVIVCQRAQHDITSTEIALKSDGKHSANYKLQKPYCDSSAKLFDIIVSQD